MQKTLFSFLTLLGLMGLLSPAPVRAQPRGPSQKAWLGVTLAKLTPLDRRQKGVPQYGGVLIQSILKGTPAAKSGFVPGDVIMRLDNKYVYTPPEVIRKIGHSRPGLRLKIDIIRNGKWLMARVLLTARPRHIPGHPGPGPRPPGFVNPWPRPALPGWPARGNQGAVLKRLISLERQVRLLRKAILELKTSCQRR